MSLIERFGEHIERGRESSSSNTARPAQDISPAQTHPLPASALMPTNTRADAPTDAPTTTAKNTKINTPRLGSDANACTEVSTPERTKKVPSKDSENAAMASNTVHALKLPRFSVTINE
jgi:hypothetical protein